MLYALICIDKPNSGEMRAQNREKHLEFLEGYRDKITLAGPVLDADNTTPRGSLIILNLDSPDAVREFVQADPYGKAGLFASITAAPFKQVLP